MRAPLAAPRHKLDLEKNACMLDTYSNGAPLGILQRNRKNQDLEPDKDPGVHFSDNLKNGKCHKLLTHILIDISQVDKITFRTIEKPSFSSFSGFADTPGPPKTIILDSGAPKLLSIIREK